MNRTFTLFALVTLVTIALFALLAIGLVQNGTLHIESRTYITGDSWIVVMLGNTDIASVQTTDNYLMQAIHTVQYSVEQIAQWVNDNIMRVS